MIEFGKKLEESLTKRYSTINEEFEYDGYDDFEDFYSVVDELLDYIKSNNITDTREIADTLSGYSKDTINDVLVNLRNVDTVEVRQFLNESFGDDLPESKEEWEGLSDKYFLENPTKEMTDLIYDHFFNNNFADIDFKAFGDEQQVNSEEGIIEFIYKNEPFTLQVTKGNSLDI